ncbi:hypothetical protein FRC07_000147 [Ceratobasidium sp. 392]|nr:hypothetical protein FRC07_000147 [Ceratobasidium sp. 392]
MFYSAAKLLRLIGHLLLLNFLFGLLSPKLTALFPTTVSSQVTEVHTGSPSLAVVDAMIQYPLPSYPLPSSRSRLSAAPGSPSSARTPSSPRPYTYVVFPRRPPPYSPSRRISRTIRCGLTDRMHRFVSWIDGTKRTLCYTQPPTIKSRLAWHAYWALHRTRLQLCRPRPPISVSLPMPPPLSPPSLAPRATRTTGGDPPATRTRSMTEEHPARPEPAHTHIVGRSRKHPTPKSAGSPSRPSLLLRLVLLESRVVSWFDATLTATDLGMAIILVMFAAILATRPRLWPLAPTSERQPRWNKFTPTHERSRLDDTPTNQDPPNPSDPVTTRELLIYYKHTMRIEVYWRSSSPFHERLHSWELLCPYAAAASAEWGMWYYIENQVWRLRKKYALTLDVEVKFRLVRVKKVCVRYTTGSETHDEWVPDDGFNGTDVFESEDEFLRHTTPVDFMDEWDESLQESSCSRSPSPPPSPTLDPFDSDGRLEPMVEVVEAGELD